MPTVEQFELAASMFDGAAEQVIHITTAAQAAEPSSILRGGSLGRQVPARIASATDTARWCHARLGFMARTCRARAAIVAEYAATVAQYNLDYERFHYEHRLWYQEYFAWWDDPYTMPYPAAPEPVPPSMPAKPYSWIEV